MALPSDKLAALRKREAELKARIAEAEAKEKSRADKDLGRVKLLVGSAFIADAERNPETRAALLDVLQRVVTSDKDRAFLKAQGWL